MKLEMKPVVEMNSVGTSCKILPISLKFHHRNHDPIPIAITCSRLDFALSDQALLSLSGTCSWSR